MTRATWNGVTLAESDACEIVDGNHYFPPDSVRREHLLYSSTRTVCPWKGTASYYTIKVGDQVNEDAAWLYPETKEGPSKSKATLRSGKGSRWIPEPRRSGGGQRIAPTNLQRMRQTTWSVPWANEDG